METKAILILILNLAIFILIVRDYIICSKREKKRIKEIEEATKKIAIASEKLELIHRKLNRDGD